MNSLADGVSPSVHARVTAVRKAQVAKLAELQGCKSSDILRDAIDAYVKLQMGSDPTVRSQLLRITQTTAE